MQNMLFLLEAMIFLLYAQSHLKYHTFEGYYMYICSFSKQNGIVTFYENYTNNML